MIKHYLITGDFHGKFSRLEQLKGFFIPEETAIIALGDFGVNYLLNSRDRQIKKRLNKLGYTFYIVRGNHEERPENVSGMELIWDNEIENKVYIEHEFLNLRYLIDGEDYFFNGKRALVIGGAYSVDKYYRLFNHMQWFPEEQLTQQEMKNIEKSVEGERFDLIFSHTCPYSFQPFDAFLSCVDQSTVDNTMEHWMEDLTTKIKWDMWHFGHFHIERYDPVLKYKIHFKDFEEIK